MKKRNFYLLPVLTAALCLILLLPGRAHAAGDVEINKNNFPDTAFRTYVSKQFDKDQNGFLSEKERTSVKIIKINEQGVTSMKGIEHFPNLTTLYCQDNKLTSLDLSSNTKLEEIYCGNNQL